MQLEMTDLSRRTQPADLPEWMDGPSTREEMRACLRDLAWTNRLFLGYRPILQWLDGLDLHKVQGPVRILDVGSGYGDTLRRVEKWAHGRGMPVELIGLDLNPDAVAIAAEATHASSRIQWLTADVFRYEPEQQPHIVLNSLFTHHLSDDEIVRFLQWMDTHAVIGWFINDLSRHATPQRLFNWFARATRLHRFVQHDGWVSFARAFVAEDWERYCAAAGLSNQTVGIRGFTPGRLCVSRRKVLAPGGSRRD